MVYFVATPIGNLGEITSRATEVLKFADVIYCEDTRRSALLLKHIGSSAPTRSYHKFNEEQRLKEILQAAREGKNIAIVSDAGMPCVSDPGRVLVNALIKDGLEYTVVSGASAFLNAFVLSGFAAPFTFVGFLPEKKVDRERLMQRVASLSAMIFYAAPHDVNENLGYLYERLGDRRVAVIKEISKIHEKVTFFNLSEARVEEPRGEYVLVTDGANEENALNGLSVEEHVSFYADKGMSKMEAIKQTARDRGTSKNEIYKLFFNKDENN